LQLPFILSLQLTHESVCVKFQMADDMFRSLQIQIIFIASHENLIWDFGSPLSVSDRYFNPTKINFTYLIIFCILFY